MDTRSALVSFEEILREFPRVAIAGGPRVGKTTLAASATDRPVIGTDAYRSHAWEFIPAKVIADVEKHHSFVLEGVQVARALRKGLRADAVVYMGLPKVTDLLPGQVSMAKGVETVLREWRSSNPDVPMFREFTPGLFLRFPLVSAALARA